MLVQTPISLEQPWQPLEQPIPIPADAHVNAKGNLLFNKDQWVPSQYAQDGVITVQPKTCSSCTVAATAEGIGNGTKLAQARSIGPHGPSDPWANGTDILLLATTGVIGLLALGAVMFAPKSP